MYYCNQCKEWFEEPNIKEWTEFHSEVDTLQYEKMSMPVCPGCGNEEIEEGYECQCCGEWRTFYNKDICSECEEELDEEVREMAIRRKMGDSAMKSVLVMYLEQKGY